MPSTSPTSAFPVQARRGRYGGYRLSPGYGLPPLMLTDDEAVAGVLGLRQGYDSHVVPADFDATTQVVSGSAAVRWSHEVSVLLRTTLADAGERPPRSAGRLSEHGDGVLLETRAEHLDGMARMLAGLGWDFEVITPDALRDEVLALSDRLRVGAVRVAVAGTTATPQSP